MGNMELVTPVKPQAMTRPPGHHFFGYYNLTPWDSTGRYLLALESDFDGRPPAANNVARIGLIDTHQGNAWRTLANTRAWNWQQACMLQWLPSAPDRWIIYNDRIDGKAVAVLRDVFSGESRTLPLPVYAVSHDGRTALTLNFARLHRVRPGYGYAGLKDRTIHQRCPEHDGIWWMNLETGRYRQIISLRQLADFHPLPSMRGMIHKVNHIQFNTDDSRFVFFHRWRTYRGPLRDVLFRAWRKGQYKFLARRSFPPDSYTRALTARPDGSDLRIVSDDGMVSHFDWRDDRYILAYALVAGRGKHYYRFDEQTGQAEMVGEDHFNGDGHCSYSPDRRWFVTDTYPREYKRWLILFDLITNRRIDLGAFHSPSCYARDFRCDLHPRWNRDGTKICFDSVHEGTRQIYVMDVSSIIRS